MAKQAIASWVLSNSHSLNVYDEFNGEALEIGFDEQNTETVEVEYEPNEEADAFITYYNRKYYLNECMKC